MAVTAPTDNGSIQGDSWHDYVTFTADSVWSLSAASNTYANAIAAL